MVRTGKRRIKASKHSSDAIPLALAVEMRPIASLKPYARNPRTHSNKQIRQIAESIRVFGFNNPVLIDRNDEIIAGHGRVEAAKLLGLESVHTIRLEHLSETEKRAYILADNKLAEKAGWDPEILAIELQNLIEMETDFSITATGFEIAEIDGLMKILDEDEAAETEEPSPHLDPEAPVVSSLGDLWRLGQHRLLCGDARDPLAYARLLKGEKARLIITDPPYNVPILGHVCGLGQVKHDDFLMASGEMTGPEFTTFLATVFTNLAAYSLDGSIHFISTDWRHLYEFLHAGRLVYTELKNLVVWAKTNAGMGSFYRSAARVDPRLQERARAPCEHLRAWPAWSLSHQSVDLSRRQQPAARPRRAASSAPDREAHQSLRRRHARLLGAGRSRARRLLRQRHRIPGRRAYPAVRLRP